MRANELTYEVIGAAIEVHRELGPGKPEAAYEVALARELAIRGIPHQVQLPVPVIYKGMKLDCGYRLDVLVVGGVVAELKAVEHVIPIHRAQVLTYLKLGGWKLALLLNFNVAVMKEGVQRLVLGMEEEGPKTMARPTGKRERPGIRASVFSLRSTGGCGDQSAEALASAVIAAAAEVHRELGPGLLPSAYEACLCHELHLREIPFETKRELQLGYKGAPLGISDKIALLVGERVVVSTQAVAELQPVHEAGVLSQLRLGDWRIGLLINFNTIPFGEGVRRIVLSRSSAAARAVNHEAGHGRYCG